MQGKRGLSGERVREERIEAAGNPSALRLEDGRKVPEYTPAFRRADRSRPQVSGAIAPSTCTRYGGGGGEICDEDHTPVWM